MNSDEAWFVLSARRPDGSDDATPAMHEALAQASRDPALAARLAAQQRFDTTLVKALRGVTPPADLRTLILTGAMVDRRSRAWWRQSPRWLAWAAGLALLAASGLGVRHYLTRDLPHEHTLAAAASLDLGVLASVAWEESRGMHPDMVFADQLGDFGRWLQNPTQALGPGVPLDFETLRALGCRVLTINGREVVEVCFKRGATYHLYIARRTDVAAPATSPVGPELLSREGASVAVWLAGDLVYALAGKGDTQVITAML
jgi:anti-sigma factor RsiW